MAIISAVPAAQYLRMSTDRQEYSMGNQADGIALYAAEHGFSIVKTYADAAKSGLALKNRGGLKQLLRDVVDGISLFKAILVYDVSRWGRFQDADEAAHYEYLCKSAGIPVHYCAETFPNDNSMPSFIMKALKRSMAGEYSRELSGKVRAGLARLAKMGYKAGGPPIYGFRRMLLDSTGKRKQILDNGQHKSLVTERVILVPGPADEVAVVRRIFHEFANEYRSLRSIANRLNDDGVFYLNGVKWGANGIRRALKHPAYAGDLVWGRTRCFLGSRTQEVPPEEWVTCKNAFEPLISPSLFEKAQAKFANLSRNLSDAEMIDRVRNLWQVEGRLTTQIIERSLDCPSLTMYHSRFGGLLNVYKVIGYPPPEFSSVYAARQQTHIIRDNLIEAFLAHSEGHLQVVRCNNRFRALLRYRKTGLLISVLLGRYKATTKGKSRWILNPHAREHHRVTVLVLLDEQNCAINQMRVVRKVGGHRFVIRQDSEILLKAMVVEHPSSLIDAVHRLRMLNQQV